MLYLHSKCCNAHWELVYHDGQYWIECEVCRQPPAEANGLQIVGPLLPEDCCDECRREREGMA